VDYCYRGEDLSSYNMVDFFVDTYEIDLTSKAKIIDDEDDELPIVELCTDQILIYHYLNRYSVVTDQ
jgi:hypothetical protein